MNSKTEQVLKVDEAGRVWTPRELRDAVLDEFERSGMPATQFAARLGVKYPTFATWVQKRRRQRKAAVAAMPVPPLRWVEATVAADVAERAVVVELPGGARVTICDSGQVRLAAELVRALAGTSSGNAGGGEC